MLPLLWLATVNAFAHTAPLAPRLDRDKLPARGDAQTVLHVAAFGHYTILAHSAQGVALQLVSRMAGPGPVAGRPGKQDGRLDLFLEKGDYLLRTIASAKGNDQVALKAVRARELNPYPAPRLTEYRIVRSSLGDLQQRSYWLQIDKARRVAIEAAGRNLADLRLWKDGNWLVDAKPVAQVTTPKPGKPLAERLLTVRLEPGLYRLTAYGGPAQPWARSSAKHPLYLRLGIPLLPEAGRRRHIAGPFGVDRWRVPGRTDYFRLELPQAEKASLGVADYSARQPFAAPDRVADIDKKSLPPVAELRVPQHYGQRLLSVRREAGKPYVLQYFHRRDSARISSPGDYWVGTLQSGYGGDAIDLTAVMTCIYGECRSGLFGTHSTVVADSAIPLDRGTGWRRRFNLLDEATLFFKVRESGNYRFTAEGVRAKLRLEPLLTQRPADYQAPEFTNGTLAQRLDPGYYKLTLRPVHGANGKGIVTLSAVPTGIEGVLAPEMNAAQTGFSARVHLKAFDDYRIALNEQPGVTHTLLVRRLPIDLAQPLPLSLAAHARFRIRVRIPETGRLSAVAEDGSLLPLTVNGLAVGKQAELRPGRYRIALQNPADRALQCSLALAPRRLSATTPLTPIPTTILNSRPRFPLLDASQARFFNVDRSQTTTVDVRVDKPAFYRLESTGLLRTEGNLRTRIVTSLERRSANGIGRNFLIAQYLGQGEYQLSTRPLGKSRGPFGLRLTRKTPIDGGELMPGIRVRRSLPADSGLLYRFHVAKAGDYRLYAMGLGRRFRARLEDAAGWPLVKPGVPANFLQHFEPGDYRLVILPQPVDARVITRFAPVPAPPVFKGHGPHDIAFDQQVKHRWLEPTKGAPRIPDQWRFEMPAAATVTIDLSRGMNARLLSVGKPISEVIGGRPWKGKLAAGHYLLETASVRPNNRFDYQLSLHSKELVAGETRTLRAPASLTVSVGAAAPVELASFGNQDVRAKLYDAQGDLVAENDDRADDWNFLISRRLTAGRYLLQVDPVGTDTATTTVGMRLPVVHPAVPLPLPAHLRIGDADVHYYVLPATPPGRLWAFAAHTGGGAGLALEHRQNSHWLGVGQQTGASPRLLMPLGPAGAAAGEYRLRVWKLERAGGPLALTGRALAVPAQAGSKLARGVVLKRFDTFDPPLGVAAVRLARPGQFALSDAAGVLWANGAGHVLETPASGHKVAAGSMLWLARDLPKGRAGRLAARRMVLGRERPLAFGLAPHARVTLDLAPLSGTGTQLVLVESPTGTPGIRPAGATPAMAGVAVAGHSAVWLRHSADPVAVRLWDSANSKVGLPLQLHLYRFDTAPAHTLASGSHDLRLAARSSLRLRLPGGSEHLRLALPAGVAAELRRHGNTLASFWSGAAPRSFEVDSRADGLVLYNTRAAPGRAALLALPASSASTLGGGRFGRYHFAASGQRALTVHLSAAEKAAGRRLHLAGPVDGLSVIEASGRILHGAAPLLHDDARVLFRHKPGFVLAWLTDATGESAADGQSSARPVRLPAAVKLVAAATAVRLNQAASGAVALHSDTPLIVRVRSPGRHERLHLFTAAADLPLYLPKGATTLLFDGLTTTAPGGTVSLRQVAAEPLAEGLSAPRMLAPGGSRLYHFHLDKARTVGVGVKASVDTVGCSLLDAGGRELGHGLLLMRHLAAGDYLLRVEAPAGGGTVEVQAALVGAKSRGDGPPPDVLRHYLKAAGLKAE
jgi:hypothetical protein